MGLISLECGSDLPILIMAKSIANEISKEAMEFRKNLMLTHTEINWGFTKLNSFQLGTLLARAISEYYIIISPFYYKSLYNFHSYLFHYIFKINCCVPDKNLMKWSGKSVLLRNSEDGHDLRISSVLTSNWIHHEWDITLPTI